MNLRLLTIIIPTYNRSDSLDLLLKTLLLELIDNENKIMIIIGNNASTDNTESVILSFQSQFAFTKVLSHSENLGPDENFYKCIAEVETKFFWFISDDDLPKSGVLKSIIQILESKNPDLLYINSEWIPEITSSDNGERVMNLSSRLLMRRDFAAQVSFGVTFISGMVVNYDLLKNQDIDIEIRKLSGTSLIQLGWVLPILMKGNNLQIIDQRCILATSGNTGGYKLFTVFAINFPQILSSICGSSSEVYQVIIRSLVWSQIPSLLWLNRFSKLGSFKDEDILNVLKPFKYKIAYWVVMIPIIYFPKILAMPFWYISKIIVKIYKFKDNIFRSN